MSANTFRTPATRATGFSLVEVLVVVAIIALLAVISIVALVPMLRASQLTQSGVLITDELSFARQTAMSRNVSVELRFYRLGAGANAKYAAFRAMEIDVIDPPLSNVKTLPAEIVIGDEAAYSTLLDKANPARSGLSAGTEQLPTQTEAAPYVSFCFHPDGSTSLRPVSPSQAKWFLTLFSESALPSAAGLPANYVTVQLEPVTGRARLHRGLSGRPKCSPCLCHVEPVETSLTILSNTPGPARAHWHPRDAACALPAPTDG